MVFCCSLLAITLIYLLGCFAHQQPSFNDATQQQPLKSSRDSHQQHGQTQQFGGEQAKDEGYV